MLVYGYTSALETVATNLSVKRIVAAGIDPWRLDLFDRDPIELTVRGKTLYFRKLSDLSFAYRAENGGQLIIGLHDGSAGTCFSGVDQATTYHSAALRHPKVSSSSFQFHLTEFLQRAVRSCPKGFQHFQSSSCSVTPVSAASIVYAPQGICAVNIRGDRLTFEGESPDGMPHGSMWPLMFTGEMMDELTVPATLSPHMNWLLRLLEEFQPSVYGECVRQCLEGKAPTTVQFVVPAGDLAGVRHLLEQVSSGMGTLKFPDPSGEAAQLRLLVDPGNSNSLDFEIGGVLYLGCVSWSNTGSPLSMFRIDGQKFSPDCLYSRKPDTITGSRIAIYDTGHRLARPLYARSAFGISTDDCWRRKVRAKELKAQGMAIIEPSGCRTRRR